MIRYLIVFNFILLSACSTNQVSKVTIENNNNYPIAVSVEANNIRTTYGGIEAHSKTEVVFDWTKIEKKDGEFHFMIESSFGRDSFAHGFFANGQLYSYIHLRSEGSQLKVEITE